MGDDFNYGASQVQRLGDLSKGGNAKLITDAGQTKWLYLTPDKLKRIAAIVAEPED